MFKHVYKYDDDKRAQHQAVRNTVGWYYFTHDLVEVTGEDATAFLDHIYANPIGTLKIGGARYTTMLNDDAAIQDDVVIFRLEENKYWISTLFAQRIMKWLDAHKGGYKAEYRKITKEWDMYAVQGPRSKDLLNAILEDNIDEQKFFQIRDNKIDGISVKISRAGFSGEKLGYEIYVSPEYTDQIEAILKEKGKTFDAREVDEFQIKVWTLPTEKGFYVMTDIHWTNPFEVGLDRGIDWDKDFIGKEALLKIKEEGPKRILYGFTIDEKYDAVHIVPRNLGGPGAQVLLGDEEIGRVYKYTYGYTVEKNIGYALVEIDKAGIGDIVSINGAEATLCERSFF
ncbi:aminomethyltransferase [Clostridia bacterium]|nr:aminomethyltransferase [Clostridia bacterium]